MMPVATEFELYNWQDVSLYTGYGKTQSCKIIHDLQEKLVKDGYIKPKAGRIPKKFFHEHYPV